MMDDGAQQNIGRRHLWSQLGSSIFGVHVSSFKEICYFALYKSMHQNYFVANVKGDDNELVISNLWSLNCAI